MNVFEFGDAKLRLKDIDPLYYAIHQMDWTQEQRCRYTLAFVSFDLAGLACRIFDAGPKKFWPAMRDAMDQTLRGAPRRYFRGNAGHTALDTLRLRYSTPERALKALSGTFADAEAEMTHWPLYGPTAYFKLADMAERVCGIPISFADVTPKQLMSNAMVTKGVNKAMEDFGWKNPEDLFIFMRKHKWATKAGPDFKRKLNMQEFETILCYYSHDDGKNKHLPGMDIENIRAELSGWGKTADALISKLPKVKK